jgi:hypothetical protein
LEGHNTAGLIELVVIVGIVGWFLYHQLAQIKKDKGTGRDDPSTTGQPQQRTEDPPHRQG